MRYKENQMLYYTNPFDFSIEEVTLSCFGHEENGHVYYIDKSGAYLEECDLFENIKEAKNYTIELLNNFYNRKLNNIRSYNGTE